MLGRLIWGDPPVTATLGDDGHFAVEGVTPDAARTLAGWLDLEWAAADERGPQWGRPGGAFLGRLALELGGVAEVPATPAGPDDLTY